MELPNVPAWLSILILIFAVILIIDAIGSFVLWKYTKNRMFLKAGIGWSANFINFAVHGAATKNNEITLNLNWSLFLFYNGVLFSYDFM